MKIKFIEIKVAEGKLARIEVGKNEVKHIKEIVIGSHSEFIVTHENKSQTTYFDVFSVTRIPI